MKIKWWVEIGLQGCSRECEIELEDDTTEAEINDIVRDEVFNYLDWGWSKEDAAAHQQVATEGK